MRVRWTLPAAEDLEAIKDYLDERYPHLAEPTVRRIYDQIQALGQWPHRGHPGHRAGTRELSLSPLPYIVVYRLKAETIEVLHVHHGAQNWQENQDP